LRINGLGRAKENTRVAPGSNSEILQRIIFLPPLDFSQGLARERERKKQSCTQIVQSGEEH
jgi:hypothetical protein